MLLENLMADALLEIEASPPGAAAARLSEFRIGMIRVPQNGNARDLRCSLFENFEDLSRQFVIDQSDSGDISARPCVQISWK
jgi:hypothetical protein